ncbi:MAG: dihydrofolate reductase [Defluviitaleaceae bacterium]|nr:dihydrofolate reductase [Defluviitaleaceae bacterium]
MNTIAIVDENLGIGCCNRLLFSIPEDMRYFKSMTTNKVVIMGHNNTFKALPGKKPLPNRVNIVLSKQFDSKNFQNKEHNIHGVIGCGSLPQLNAMLQKYDLKDVFVIGGQTIYEQLPDQCTCAYITKVQAQASADTFFPNPDQLSNRKPVWESELKHHNNLAYRFSTYISVMPESLNILSSTTL